MTLRTSLAALAIVLVTLGGCEDEVDPTLGTEQAFSFFGYLNPTADRQAIRVIPIEATILAESDGQVDATVTTTDLGTGEVVTWRDSVVTFENGTVGNVFVADYTPTPGSRVQLRAVAGEDGQEATVDVEVPPLAQAVLEPAIVVAGATAYPVSVTGVPNVLTGRLRVIVTGFPAAPQDTTALDIPIENLDIQQNGSTWTTVVPFLRATQAYLRSTNLDGAGLRLITAEFSPFVANAEWNTMGLNDDALVEPGTFSNVTGGFGFVGAGYLTPVRWIPSLSTQSRAGFSVDSDPASQIVVNEIGDGFVELYNPTIEPINLAGYIVSDGTAAAGTEIIGAGLIDSRNFFVVSVPFVATESAVITLYSTTSRPVSQTIVEQLAVGEQMASSFGSYPDGRSFQLPQGGPNVFKGPLTSTPGQPNRPAFVPAVLNEIYSAGDGWVEAVAVAPVRLSLQVSSSAIDIVRGPRATPVGGTFVADENGGPLTLDQTGGEVFLLANYGEAEEPTGFRVVDYRAYGPQDPTRSTGYLPDGPAGAWTEGLIPTRGAPNSASGRLASN